MIAKLKGRLRCGALMHDGFIFSYSIAENIPAMLVAKTSGKISKIFVLPNNIAQRAKNYL
jgi:hypothetical protein